MVSSTKVAPAFAGAQPSDLSEPDVFNPVSQVTVTQHPQDTFQPLEVELLACLHYVEHPVELSQKLLYNE